MKKCVAVFPCFGCLKWVSGVLCFVSFHVSVHFSGNRKNCGRITEGFLPQYLPQWLFYFWPQIETKVYMADIRMSNVYSLYWLKMSHASFALIFFSLFVWFFLFSACGYWWDVRVVTGSDFRVEALSSLQTRQCWGSTRNERIQTCHVSASLTEKYMVTFWVVTSLAQNIPQEGRLDVRSISGVEEKAKSLLLVWLRASRTGDWRAEREQVSK